MAAPSSSEATATSAPRRLKASPLSALRTSTRTFSPLSRRVLATTDPVFPVTPVTTYMIHLRPRVIACGPYVRATDRHRTVDPLRRLRAPGRRGEARDRSGRGLDPRRRDGRSLRPQP